MKNINEYDLDDLGNLKLERDFDEGLYIKPTGIHEMPLSEMNEIIEICNEKDIVLLDRDINKMKAQAYEMMVHRLDRIKNIITKWAV